MKKLLIASDAFLPRWDGVARFLNEIIPFLQDQYEITVLSPHYGDLKHDFKINLIQFKTFNLTLGDYQPSTISISRVIKEVKKADIIFVQSLGLIGIAAILVGNRMRKPITYYSHLIDWELYPKSIDKKYLKPFINSLAKITTKFFLNRTNLIFVPSLETLELFSYMGINTKKKIVHLGVNTNKFTPADKKRAKEKIGIDPNNFAIGYVGRLGNEKNLFTLYRAFVRLKAKYKNVNLLIVGDGRKDIEKLFYNKKRTYYVGAQANPIPFYQAMDVHVLPSLEETTSLSTLEAMSCQIAVISTEVGLVKEYLIDGENGLFFPKKDSYILSKKIEMLINKPSLKNQLALNARSTVINNFSWEKTAKSIAESINEF